MGFIRRRVRGQRTDTHRGKPETKRMQLPQLTYDPEANALYMRFSDNEIAETLEFSESVYVDVDADGIPVGLEVLDASSSLLTGLPGASDTAALKDLMTRDAA